MPTNLFNGLRYLVVVVSLFSRFYFFDSYERFIFYVWRTCPYSETFWGQVVRKLFLVATALLDYFGSGGTEVAMASSFSVFLAQKLMVFPQSALVHQGTVLLLHLALFFFRVFRAEPPGTAVERPRVFRLEFSSNLSTPRIVAIRRAVRTAFRSTEPIVVEDD